MRIMDRIERYRVAEKCGAVTEEIVDAWIEWFRDPQFSVTFRNKISVQIMEFAIGRPAMQVSVDANSQELKPTKVIHLVRWLPPDPNDRSIEIAPNPISQLPVTARRAYSAAIVCTVPP